MSRMITRAFSKEALNVVNNVARQQFMVTLRNVDAVLEYDKKSNTITFIRTDVPKQFQGKGVGKLLAKYAFDHAHQNKLNVICQCHFLAKFYEKNHNNYKGLKVQLDLKDDED